MIKKEVMANTLAPLFLLIKDLEPVPEPFRCQPNLCLIVDIQQYIEFIKTSLDKLDFLSTSTATLKKLVLNESYTELTSCFYLDMSRAVCKELHYAEAYNKDATKYQHVNLDIDMNVPLDEKSLQEYFYKVKVQTEEPIRSYMSDCGFYLPKTFRTNNKQLWEYANVLYFFYKVGSMSFNLEKLWLD